MQLKITSMSLMHSCAASMSWCSSRGGDNLATSQCSIDGGGGSGTTCLTTPHWLGQRHLLDMNIILTLTCGHAAIKVLMPHGTSTSVAYLCSKNHRWQCSLPGVWFWHQGVWLKWAGPSSPRTHQQQQQQPWPEWMEALYALAACVSTGHL